MADDVVCRVCLLPFDDSSREPLLFICAHSFCAECVAKLPLPLTCQVCRIETPGAAADLPRNLALLAALPKLLPQKSLDKCVECKAEAALFCASCGALCQACSEKIHAFNAFSSHTIVSIDAKETLVVPMCAEHAEKALLYCPSDNALICILCRDYGKHKDHPNVMTLDDAVAQRVRWLRGLIAQADRAQKLDCLTAAILSEQELMKQAAINVRAEIDAYFREAYQILADYERQMVTLVNTEEAKLTKAFNEQRFDIARACAALQTMKAQALHVCAGSKAQILQAPEVVFPEIQLLSEPCFSCIDFEVSLPEIPELGAGVASDSFAEKEYVETLAERFEGLALCPGERLDVCDAEDHWHTAVILDTQGASFLVHYEEVECEEWLHLGSRRFAALGTHTQQFTNPAVKSEESAPYITQQILPNHKK